MNVRCGKATWETDGALFKNDTVLLNDVN